MTRQRSFAVAWLTAALTFALVGCGDEGQAAGSVEDRAERVAADARTHIDAFAERVGTAPQVTQDVLTDCIPGQRDSGLELIYSIDVTIEPDAMGRISSDVAETYRDEGWDVRTRGRDEVVFERAGVTMSAILAPSAGRASVGGTGGCVR